MCRQIKSKKRVANFGEVYTNEREVNAMLDLVKEESYRIDARILEPACGNGNFLIKILERKLTTVLNMYGTQRQYEELAFIAVASIYAIDILADNVKESRERLFTYVKEQYTALFGVNANEAFCEAIQYLLTQNIIQGDGLTAMRVPQREGEETPIVFAQWALDNKMVFRQDFRMLDMVNNDAPSPCKYYSPIHYLRVGEIDE